MRFTYVNHVNWILQILKKREARFSISKKLKDNTQNAEYAFKMCYKLYLIDRNLCWNVQIKHF